MYVGDVHDGTGLEHMLWEVVANALDQHLAGYARVVSVAVDGDGAIEVVDDGQGIPLHQLGCGRSHLEEMFVVIHATPTRDHHFPHVHLTPSMRGVGLLPVAALSSRFDIETVHRGQRGRMGLASGEVATPFSTEQTDRRSGTRIRFLPDVTVFGAQRISRVRVEARLRELAWLVPQLELRWCGEVLPGRGGLFEQVRELGAAVPILATRREIDGVEVDLAIGWAESPSTTIHSFVNYQRSIRGTHVRGLFDGLAELASDAGFRVDAAEARECLARGLRAVVHVGLLDPSFGSPTRDHLLSPVAAAVTKKAIVEAHHALATGLWYGPERPASSPFTDELCRRLQQPSGSAV